jgi:protein-S-isoprenylcysteine O-methyltransferase Ste14
VLCLAGVAGYRWGLASFAESFRVGIDQYNPGSLMTHGVFRYSRNPLYVSLLIFYFGLGLVFANLAMALNLAVSLVLILRQIFREEKFLQRHYGYAYSAYCRKTGRFGGKSRQGV